MSPLPDHSQKDNQCARVSRASASRRTEGLDIAAAHIAKAAMTTLATTSSMLAAAETAELVMPHAAAMDLLHEAGGAGRMVGSGLGGCMKSGGLECGQGYEVHPSLSKWLHSATPCRHMARLPCSNCKAVRRLERQGASSSRLRDSLVNVAFGSTEGFSNRPRF